MKKLVFFFICLWIVQSLSAQTKAAQSNKALNEVFEAYWEEGLKLLPLSATVSGDNRYNDQLPAEFTDSYRKKIKDYNSRYLTALAAFNRKSLTDNDRLSYDILKWQLTNNLEGLKHRDNRMPFNQFDALPLTLAQMGSGRGTQPFKTVQDYENWLRRAADFSVWTDSAIAYFRKGMVEGIVLPRALVVKMIPQMENLIARDAVQSAFYGPVTNFPQDFTDADKVRLTASFVKLITGSLMPSYQKLRDFLKDEYLLNARATSGLGALPDGASFYKYVLRWRTTTNLSAEQIYNLGLAEVKRIRNEMERVKRSAGFEGDLNAFFAYMRKDPKFFPYKTPEEVLAAYRAIEQKIGPVLQTLFSRKPETSFEIRQTEAYRAATASAGYTPGAPDGSRPGIFFIPVVDATKMTVATETLFIHEALPGHHFQLMLQRENENLPKFRRFGSGPGSPTISFSAFIEGWGLYTESLGKELGLYTDPYQQMANLANEIRRAIRLVVDPGLHAKGWTREQAIQYMLNNEPLSEQEATAEVERYMARYGQAASYKIGGMKFQELRKKYEKQLGKDFNLTAFHDEILKDGAMPLEILEAKMDAWAKKQRSGF